MALSSVLPSVLPSLLPRCDQTRGDVRSSSSLGPQAPVLTRGEAGKWVSQGQKLPMGSPVLHSPRWLQGSLHTPWPGCHEPGEPESRRAHCSYSGGASAAGRLRSTEGTTRCAPCWPGESGGHIAGGPQQPSGLVLFRARDSGRTGGFSGAQDGRDSAALPETVRKQTACAGEPSTDARWPGRDRPLGPWGGHGRGPVRRRLAFSAPPRAACGCLPRGCAEQAQPWGSWTPSQGWAGPVHSQGGKRHFPSLGRL